MVCAGIHHMLPPGKRGVGSPCSMTGPDARWTSQKSGSWREVRCLGGAGPGIHFATLPSGPIGFS